MEAKTAFIKLNPLFKVENLCRIITREKSIMIVPGEAFEQVKIKTSEQINFAGDEKTGPVDCRPYQEVSFEYALQIKGHRKKG